MGFNVVKDLGLQSPTEKVQLPNSGHKGLVARDFEHDALPTAVGVKVLFRVGLELSFIAEIDEELLAMEGVTDKRHATVLGHEPVDDAQRERGLAVQVRHDFGDVGIRAIEALERGNDELGLTFNAALSGLHGTCLWGGRGCLGSVVFKKVG